MKVRADALALPLPDACVDAVISNPPYPGNGAWEGGYLAGLDAAMGECRRVLRAGGRGWFLLGKQAASERWLAFDHHSWWWAHEGHSAWPADTSRPGTYWGVVSDADIVPILLTDTRPGDVVLDPFAGTGGIPRLAARLGRVPVGVDIDVAQLTRGGRY